MEKFLLTSRNLANSKRQGAGQLSVFEQLQRIADFENVHIDADFPEQELILHWEECFTPLYATRSFRELISAKLYSYKFQYLAAFEFGEQKIKCGGTEGSNCETFAARMENRLVFRSLTQESKQCNCTWLIDFLLNAESIASDPLRNEKIIWQQTRIGYELVLEQSQNKGKITERQIFSFQNQFESLSWGHDITLC